MLHEENCNQNDEMDPTIQLQSARRQLLKSLNGSFASHLDRHVNDNATFLGASYDYLAYLESLRERFGRDDGGDEAPLSLYTVGSNECGQAGVGVENVIKFRFRKIRALLFVPREGNQF